MALDFFASKVEILPVSDSCRLPSVQFFSPKIFLILALSDIRLRSFTLSWTFNIEEKKWKTDIKRKEGEDQVDDWMELIRPSIRER